MRFFIILTVAAGLCFAQPDKAAFPSDRVTVPDMREVNPDSVKVGADVCIFGFGVSVDGHVWVHPSGFYYDRVRCLAIATKTKSGWKLTYLSFKLSISKESDQTLRRLGYIKMDEIDLK